MNPILIDLPVPIKTPRLLLRHCLPGDGKALNLAVCESFTELNQWVPWADKIPSEEDSEFNVRTSYAQWILREDLRMMIFDLSGNRLLGSTGLHRIKWEVPAFEIGYWLRKSEAGKGYITEAVNA